MKTMLVLNHVVRMALLRNYDWEDLQFEIALETGSLVERGALKMLEIKEEAVFEGHGIGLKAHHLCERIAPTVTPHRSLHVLFG